jgi:hypothetical protein
MKKILLGFSALLVLGIWFFSGTAPDFAYRILPGYVPDPDRLWDEDPFVKSEATEGRIPAQAVAQRAKAQIDSSAEPGAAVDKVILFGDTHVHTTNSIDAFLYSLPMMQGGQGAFPPSYACDYARYVAQLDFYFLSDHAESATPQQWSNAIDSVQECNSLAGDNPDMFAFMGFEWTQVGKTAEEHYGHHNVLYKDEQRSKLPDRPIAAKKEGSKWSAKLPTGLQWLDPRHKDYYASFNAMIDTVSALSPCAEDVPSPQLPADCFEAVKSPGELYSKLDEWGLDTIVIPHGTAWGNYTPPNANWSHQLNADNIDADKGRLIEVYSGHGNSEQYASFNAREFDENGNPYCPQPTREYLPACWQAGEIIRKRCAAAGESAATCEARAVEARGFYAAEDTQNGFVTVPGTEPEDWLDAGQARGMFLPAFSYRPKKSVQYGLALRNFDDQDKPLSYQWGFIASSDTHSARAGHGFKQKGRLQSTEANGSRSPVWEEIIMPEREAPAAQARPVDSVDIKALKLRASDFERTSSYLSVGGLAAVHAADRSRDGIWQAMKRKETYATSGHKMLLWFDYLSVAGNPEVPMGGKVETASNPSFKVKAVGSFKQLPGCPGYVKDALEAKRLLKMSLGECYNPSDERYAIERIEVVRIRPQSYQGEPVENLIEDPWLVHECNQANEVCEFTFSDPDFAAGNRDALYYARAIEEPIDMINAANLRTTFDGEGNAVATKPCYGDYRTPANDECLAKAGHRAWSSPIFVGYKQL